MNDYCTPLLQVIFQRQRCINVIGGSELWYNKRVERNSKLLFFFRIPPQRNLFHFTVFLVHYFKELFIY